MMNICIFCEGKTELNYIRSLNRYLKSCNIFELSITAKDLGGVRQDNYFHKIKKYRARDLRYFKHFYAWLDYDIFKRGGQSPEAIKRKIGEISFNGNSVILLLNYMNGEDFIILHEGESRLGQWKDICNREGHFDNPMNNAKYFPLFKGVVPHYEKGDVPDLDREKIEKCISNIDNEGIPFKSDIKEILEKVLNAAS